MHQHGIERVSGADLSPPCSLNKAQAQSQGFCMKNGTCEQVLKTRSGLQTTGPSFVSGSG